MKSQYDICFIQESLVSDSVQIDSLRSRWPGPSFWSPAIGRQGGVGVLINENFDGKVLSWKRDSGGRVISLLLDCQNQHFNCINIYAPTVLTDRKSFFESLHEFFIPAQGIILGGDFNCYESALDKFGGNVCLHNELSDLKSNFRFVDVWRKLHPRLREFTWFNSTFSIASRLDKFFLSKNITNLVASSSILPCVFSDHDFVNLVLNIVNLIPRGPGVWKFNNSLLSDTSFVEHISARIIDLSGCIGRFLSVKAWWDFFKLSIKNESIDFAKRKRKQLSSERVLLTNRLIACKQLLVQGDNSLVSEIVTLEAQLKALSLRELDGAKIRSRVQWIEEGERPTRFFLKMEHARAEKNRISSILNKDGLEVSSREELEAAHVDFYQELFTATDIDFECQQTLLHNISNRLTDSERVSCEGAVSLPELTESLKSLSCGKTPGPDGLTLEFFICFWNLLGSLLLRVYNECFRDGDLPDSMKASVTRLIYKKKGDIKDLKNWRPISLLNVDYKICSKAIALRLSKVLHSLVDPDQTCSVPGRSISANLTLLRDLLDYIERTNETGILVSLDQEKAFDRVNRTFLLNLLSHFGFGPDFLKWIRTFYSGANMRIILNGWLTGPIALHRGVRQGDPLSPLLYILCDYLFERFSLSG